MRYLGELKHSIRTHMLLLGGPTPQLAVFLVKVVDFLEDGDVNRRDRETAQLTFSLIESLALHVFQLISNKTPVPIKLKTGGDDLLLLLGRCRGLDDKIEAKYILLKRIVSWLDDIGRVDKTKYPTITDVNGNQL